MTKLKEALEKLLEAAHPAYVSDDHFRKKLIVARDNALQELESHRLDMEDHIAGVGNMVSLRDQFAMQEAIEKMTKNHSWQPIETAPDDVPYLVCGGNMGTEMSYVGAYGVAKIERRCYSEESRFYVADTCYYEVWIDTPTHWMPLPEPPKE